MAAGSSFIAFVSGAIIPLLPFLLLTGTAALVSSVVVSLTALFLLGLGVSRLTGRPPDPLRPPPDGARWCRCAHDVPHRAGHRLRRVGKCRSRCPGATVRRPASRAAAACPVDARPGSGGGILGACHPEQLPNAASRPSTWCATPMPGDPGAWDGDDDLRPLSLKGRRQAERLGAFLVRAGDPTRSAHQQPQGPSPPDRRAHRGRPGPGRGGRRATVRAAAPSAAWTSSWSTPAARHPDGRWPRSGLLDAAVGAHRGGRRGDEEGRARDHRCPATTAARYGHAPLAHPAGCAVGLPDDQVSALADPA